MSLVYCQTHNRKENFVIPEIPLFHELSGGPKKKACRKCVEEGKLKLVLSGQLRETCPIHSDEHLWIAGTDEEFEKTREFFRDALNPTAKWEQVVPKPARSKILR